MRFTIWGSCSGTEPMPGRHHTSWTLEQKGEITWFDAGENCGYAAHTAGRDLLRTRRIFLTHSHMDHIGGLLHLLWTIRKMTTMRPETPPFAVDVYFPEIQVYHGLMQILRCTEGGFEGGYEICPHLIQPGTLYDTPELTVRCLANHHLDARNQPSYSYAVRADKTRVVWSGDVKSWRDTEAFLREGCDLMLMESGHHDPAAVAAELKVSGYRIDNLLFVHHGRRILYDPYGQLEKIREAFGPDAQIACDGMTFSEEDLAARRL